MSDGHPKERRIGIVTGASAGLGAEFAKQLEQHYYVDEIWLIARRTEPMEDIAASLVRTEGVVLSLDLGKADDLAKIREKLANENPLVVTLINNAGFGKIGRFIDINIDSQLQCISINASALVALTQMCLPYMREHSQIINVASSIAWVAAPNFAIYSASKAFVLNFSVALREELRGQGIQVLAVCPGPVKTEFFDVANNPKGMGKANADVPSTPTPPHYKLAAEAADVVNLAYRDCKSGKAYSIYGFPIRVFVLLAKFLPAEWVARLTANRV